ncbi:2-phosphosulfolactate phosphatase [Methanobrevibacter gottschalkii]|uniref:2-phosphosulfolactate phosphatase n=2 Tax=Methanobrevibacter gottschalkii TaxID=190974 RepID=A0A3N5B5F2_9EURY|nr:MULTISPECIES: 2-phosphosulfolactate phosphatase [Methanobrevibacter]MCQ2970139.1 2-phosphosulfolactate phosphatase [archaeon]OEC93786.1 2-phosphosulfolactate phosphatase [Methanobrevibacter sp. A27]RPF52624.1 2-phosphosulfolactate phosphatase [Methanobrevibacter gottschalkii DSM 11977]SEK31011.1 2-phosphosulfolactate phosphatase [Methanobrevibacter gottschalkii]
MKVTLSFEKSESSDVSIMVDALRASSTITLALNNFEKVIPCFTPEEAFKLKEKLGGIVAGERDGKKINGFDLGNSPADIKDYTSDHLILTTSNGTRILENMKSTVLIGSIINACEVANKSIEIANNHIDVVMAGVKGEFAIEDFLAAGEILYWILQELPDCNLSEYAKAAVLASRNYESLKESFFNSRSGKRLIELGYESDVELCSLKNISNNVAIYENQELTLLKD